MGLLQVWSQGQSRASAVSPAPLCLAEREGPRAGHALGLPSPGGRIWGKGLLQFMISVTLAGGPVRVPERTESQSISSRFLLQVLTPPLRYSHSSSHSAPGARSPALPVLSVGPVLPLGQHGALLSLRLPLPTSFRTTALAGFVPTCPLLALPSAVRASPHLPSPVFLPRFLPAGNRPHLPQACH